MNTVKPVQDPKDHTVVFSAQLGGGADGKIHQHKIYYKDYAKYEYLPVTVQCDEIKQEYELFWRWNRMKDDCGVIT
jgi:hypothetical protein